MPATMAVLWQNSGKEDGANEEVKVRGGADRLCPLGRLAAGWSLGHKYFGRISSLTYRQPAPEAKWVENLTSEGVS